MLGRKDTAREKESSPGWLGRKRTVFALSSAALFIGWGVMGEHLRSREMQREIDRLEARAAEMEAKNRELADLGATVSSEAMLEREARLKMNLQKPGEQVVVVNGSPASNRVETSPGTPGRPAASEANAAKWWRYFFR